MYIYVINNKMKLIWQCACYGINVRPCPACPRTPSDLSTPTWTYLFYMFLKYNLLSTEDARAF